MDAGADTGARGLPVLLAAGGAPRGLSARATLAVMDRALLEEASWHAGSFLHQTVFTCLYMLAPDRCAAHRGATQMHPALHQAKQAWGLHPAARRSLPPSGARDSLARDFT